MYIVGNEPLTQDNFKSIIFLPLHIYGQMKYYMCNDSINYAELVDNPGYSVLLKNLVLLNKTKLPSWFGGKILDKKGNFSVTIPLNKVFSIFEIYNKPIIRVSQTLELLRNIDDSNCLIVPTALKDKVKVNITDVFWEMPIIKPSPNVEIEINKIIETNKANKIPFKNWSYKNPVVITAGVKSYTWDLGNMSKQPLYAIFAFQIDKDRNIEKDNTKFEFKNLKNVKVMLDDKEYPGTDLGLDFENNIYGKAYTRYEDFKSSYENYIKMDPRLYEYILSNEEFADKPIFIIDLSYITSEFTFNNAVQANTRIYCLIVSDAEYSYNPLTNLVTKNY